jgi:hypothetical protein
MNPETPDQVMPGAALSGEIPDQIVGVHIGNPLLTLRPEFSPAANFIGMVLLWRLLELALLGARLARENSCVSAGGELNDCIFLAAVTDRHAAAETIERALKSVTLLDHSQIGFLRAEGWQCIYPSSDLRLSWLMDTERLDFAAEKFLQAQAEQLNLVRRAFELLNRDKDQGGSKQ